MADAGEGLIDAQARIQERMDDLEQARVRRSHSTLAGQNPERWRRGESLRLARTELTRQLAATSHAARREQLASALAELDRQLAELGL